MPVLNYNLIHHSQFYAYYFKRKEFLSAWTEMQNELLSTSKFTLSSASALT